MIFSHNKKIEVILYLSSALKVTKVFFFLCPSTTDPLLLRLSRVDGGTPQKFRVTSPTTEQPTSGLGNSLDSRWGSCDRLDSLNHSHSWAGGGVRPAGSSLGIGVSYGRGGGEQRVDQGEYDDDVNVCSGSGDRLLLGRAMRGGQGSNIIDNRGGSSGKDNLKLSGGDAGIVIIPQEHEDFTLYTEIDDIRQHDDQYYDGDEFHA